MFTFQDAAGIIGGPGQAQPDAYVQERRKALNDSYELLLDQYVYEHGITGEYDTTVIDDKLAGYHDQVEKAAKAFTDLMVAIEAGADEVGTGEETRRTAEILAEQVGEHFPVGYGAYAADFCLHGWAKARAAR